MVATAAVTLVPILAGCGGDEVDTSTGCAAFLELDSTSQIDEIATASAQHDFGSFDTDPERARDGAVRACESNPDTTISSVIDGFANELAD